MKKIFLALGLLLLIPTIALAQAPTKICVESSDGRNCPQVSSTAPFPVTVSGSGGSAGVVSNSGSNVVPTATNMPTVAYMYNWDGAAWDQATGLNTGTPTAPSTDILSVQNYPVTPAATAALATSRVVKASAGFLYGLNVSADSTLSGAAWWVMVHNTAVAPTGGGTAVTPIKCYAQPSGATQFNFSFPTPLSFSTGISITVSTTGCFTQTDSIHAFISGDAQ